MISSEKSFLFIHIPKTGGNSIQQAIKLFSDDDFINHQSHQDGVERFELRHPEYELKKHSTLSDYKTQLPRTIYSQLFKFSIIRNPWDMMISLYFSPHRKTEEWDRNTFSDLIDQTMTFRERLHLSLKDQWQEGVLFSKLFHSSSWTRNVDFLLRFEHLNQDFGILCEKLAIPRAKLPHYNRSTRKHYTHYYDEELREKVAKRFKAVITYGNYHFGE